jgi:hypothetical protein
MTMKECVHFVEGRRQRERERLTDRRRRKKLMQHPLPLHHRFLRHKRRYDREHGGSGGGDGGGGRAWDVSVDAEGRKLSGIEMRAAAEASLTRMGFRRVECWTGDECMYWSCHHCPSRV